MIYVYSSGATPRLQNSQWDWNEQTVKEMNLNSCEWMRIVAYSENNQVGWRYETCTYTVFREFHVYVYEIHVHLMLQTAQLCWLIYSPARPSFPYILRVNFASHAGCLDLYRRRCECLWTDTISVQVHTRVITIYCGCVQL